LPQAVEHRALLRALRALKKGDFAVRMPLDMIGIDGEIAQAFNDVVEMKTSRSPLSSRASAGTSQGGSEQSAACGCSASVPGERGGFGERAHRDLVRSDAAVCARHRIVANGRSVAARAARDRRLAIAR